MKRMGRRERKRRVFALIISAVVLCFLAAGCSLPQSGDSEASGGSNSSETVQEKNAGQVQRTVFAMNTMMNLRAFGENAEAAIEAAEEEIRQLQNRKRKLLNQKKDAERKARTHRLIERGAILESLLEKPEQYSNEQIKDLLEIAFQTAQAQEHLRKIGEENGEN